MISPSRDPRGRKRAREPVVAQDVEESDAWLGLGSASQAWLSLGVARIGVRVRMRVGDRVGVVVKVGG